MKSIGTSFFVFAFTGFLAAGFQADLSAFSPLSDPGYALDNGDVNGDHERDISDVLYLFSNLYLGGPAPVPLAYCAGLAPAVANGDSNADGAVDLSDGIQILGWLFIGAAEPAAACGDGGGAARNQNPRVIPPHAKAYGHSYGFWAGDWWRWVFEVPAAVNPLVDEAGENCDEGQDGKVWYLAGKLCVETTGAGCTEVTAVRDCTVPPGKAIFFPIANGEWDNLGVDPPFSEEELRALVKDSVDTVTVVSCEVDGVSIAGLDPPDSAYRVSTEKSFSYDLPDGNIFDLFGFDFDAQTVSGAVAEGYYLMLAPLSKGGHTIHYAASFSFGFALDITFNITVE